MGSSGTDVSKLVVGLFIFFCVFEKTIIVGILSAINTTVLQGCCVYFFGFFIIGFNFDGVLKHFDSVIGLERLRAIHINDSKNPIGSHKDRHAPIGEGTLGMETFRAIVNNPALKELPFFLETPQDLEGYGREIALLRSL